MKKFNIIYTSQATNPTVNDGVAIFLADIISGLLQLSVPIQIFTTGRHYPNLLKILNLNNIELKSIEIKILINGNSKLKRLDPYIGDHSSEPKKIIFMVKSILRISIIKYFLFGIRRIEKKLNILTNIKKIFPELIAHIHQNTEQSIENKHIKFDVYYKQECKEFSKKLMQDKEIDRLFFTNAFNGYLVQALQEKKNIVTFSDFINPLFPSLFPCTPKTTLLMKNIATSVRFSKAIICYSKFSRDYQLTQFDISPAKSRVIPYAFHSKAEDNREINIDFNQFVQKNFPALNLPVKLQFGHFDYVLYPTVDRPHKNLLLAIRAVEQLIKKKFMNLKMILTTPIISQPVIDYITQQKLHRDIIFMPSLPVSVLNQLIKGAALLIHPSLAEGGDIVNFSRAVSNNCPALLADIPAAQEMFERHEIHFDQYNQWLFNPYDTDKLADIIQITIPVRENLLDQQKNAYEKMRHYTLAEMARNYYQFYCSI